MKNKKLDLICETTSPLHRIMSVYNADAVNRKFVNNICAFHIGKGIIVSVAHNLRTVDRLPVILSESYYQHELLAKVNAANHKAFDQAYIIDPTGQKRTLTAVNQASATNLIKKLDEAGVDRRYRKLYDEGCCKPFLVSSFRDLAFCGDAALNASFTANHHFHEQRINRHTFIIELELLEDMPSEDIAIYRTVNTRTEIVAALPSIEVDFELYDTGTDNYYCLQTAPYDNLGRIINEASIDGIMDNFSKEKDQSGKTYIMDGLRYLIKGYFRFGSSGAPYLIYDQDKNAFRANAVQSQASFIQMAIKNSMDGNRQYLNGIATPLSIVKDKIEARMAT